MAGRRRYWIILALLGIMILLGGCEFPTQAPAGVTVWIDVPVNGLIVPEGIELFIEGHAASPTGITTIEIWINGSLEFLFDSPPTQNDLAPYSQSWIPPSQGKYTIQVIAFSTDGAFSDPAQVQIQVGTPPADDPAPVAPEPPPEDESPATPTFTPSPTLTFTPLPPDVVINFWAEPNPLQAGACFTLYWQVENVAKIVFGGIEQKFEGSYSDCLCQAERYSLTITHTDGTEEIRYTDIEVTGTCATPTFTPTATFTPSPVPDTIPPPAPQQLKPSNGGDLGCVAGTALRWTAPNDPSGISEYQVEVQRHPGDNNWQSAGGSPFTGLGELEKEINVECGYQYRWRVRAIDGAANTGDWSSWFTFNVPLG
jgi:hypothetical protein